MIKEYPTTILNEIQKLWVVTDFFEKKTWKSVQTDIFDYIINKSLLTDDLINKLDNENDTTFK